MAEAEGAGVPKTVNAQVVDSVVNNNFNVVGVAPAQSMSMLYQSAASSAALSIQNGTTHQNELAQIGKSVTSTACTMILKLAQ